MRNGRVEVITSVERRRRWSAAEKQQLVVASLEPSASVSAIAREAGIHPSQLYGRAHALQIEADRTTTLGTAHERLHREARQCQRLCPPYKLCLRKKKTLSARRQECRPDRAHLALGCIAFGLRRALRCGRLGRLERSRSRS